MASDAQNEGGRTRPLVDRQGTEEPRRDTIDLARFEEWRHQKRRRQLNRLGVALLVVFIVGGAVTLWLRPDSQAARPGSEVVSRISRDVFRSQTRSGPPRRRRAMPRIPPDVTYSTVDSYVVPGFKRSLDVRLNRRVSEGTLRALALELKSQETGSYERTFICYYLPDMKVDAGAWATTHFNPNLEVRILGLTVEQDKALRHRPADPSQDVIGSWIDDSPFAGNRITIFRQHGELFMETTYKDGSAGTAELVEMSTPRARRFDHKPDRGHGEYYLINSTGDLEQWDQDGPFLTARKIR